MTGALQATTPLQAQQEHDQLWANMFTPTAGRIAKERAQFQTPAGVPTFTEQQTANLNMGPQERINASMGGGWAGMSPQERRVQLQQRTGQVPDFADPMAAQTPQVAAAPTQAPTPFTARTAPPAAPPAQQAPPSMAPPPTVAQANTPPPMEQTPPDFGVAQEQARNAAGDVRPLFGFMPPSTPTMQYRGQPIPAVPEGGINMNKMILDEAERVRQLGLQRRAAQEPMWNRIAQMIAPPVSGTAGYQPGASFARQQPVPSFEAPAPDEQQLPWLYGGWGGLFHR